MFFHLNLILNQADSDVSRNTTVIYRNLTCENQRYSSDMLMQVSWNVPYYARRNCRRHQHKPDIMNSNGTRNIRLDIHRHTRTNINPRQRKGIYATESVYYLRQYRHHHHEFISSAKQDALRTSIGLQSWNGNKKANSTYNHPYVLQH